MGFHSHAVGHRPFKNPFRDPNSERVFELNTVFLVKCLLALFVQSNYMVITHLLVSK